MNFRNKYILLFLFTFATTFSQTRNELLAEETRTSLNNAIEQSAFLLSANSFLKSVGHYSKALEIMKKIGNTAEVRNELEESIAILTIMNEDVEKSNEFFSNVLSLRKDALGKNANSYSPYFWKLAEEKFGDAIEEYNDKDYADASDLIFPTIDYYARAIEYAGKTNDLLFKWMPKKNADNLNAFLLSPANYSEGLEYYFSAIENIFDGEDVQSIDEDISEASKYFDKSSETAKDFAKLYTPALASREEARTALAETYAASEWREAESILFDAGSEFEDEDLESAKELAAEAINKYKLSKHVAVRERYLFVPRQKIALAEENDANEYSPITFDEAQRLYLEAERLIESDSYTETQVEEIAKKAESQADKAQWITDVIKSVEDGKTTWEEVILKWNAYEISLGKIIATEQRDYTKPVQKGVASPVKSSSKQINIGSYPLIDMEVFEQDNKILVRVYNINFNPAGWRLNDDAKIVLDQLANALESLDGSQYEINSFTDDVGAQRTNIEISEARAAEILNYLKNSSSFLANKMTSAGQGEKNPVTSNSSFEGRKKNNRIEILVSD